MGALVTLGSVTAHDLIRLRDDALRAGNVELAELCGEAVAYMANRTEMEGGRAALRACVQEINRSR